jgi:hypothetical protein
MQIRSTKDFKLDVTELVDTLKANKEKIASLSLKTDARLTMINKGQIITNINKDEL